MERAYSFIEWKAVADEQRTLEGWATRVEPDRSLDVVEPRGAVFKLPLPLLMDHDHRSAVGSVTDATVTDHGIRFKAQIAKCSVPCAPGATIDSIKSFDRQLLRRNETRVVRLGKPASSPRKTLPVVNLDNAPWVKREATTTPADPVASAVGRALDEHLQEEERARELLKLGVDGMLAKAIAAGSKAADSEIAALRARLDRLERGR